MSEINTLIKSATYDIVCTVTIWSLIGFIWQENIKHNFYFNVKNGKYNIYNIHFLLKLNQILLIIGTGATFITINKYK